MAEALLVRGLEQTWAELPVNLDSRANDPFSILLFDQHLMYLRVSVSPW